MSFGQAKDEDVSTLIARKNFTRAIEIIKNQLKTQRPDPRLRLQLGDVLVMAGKTREAVAILTPLADEFAREGFAAKAISVLKKIQKIDPGARDVNAKLASLIQEKQQHATVPMPTAPSGGLEIGMEEIGFDFGGGGSVTVPAETRRSGPPEIAFEAEAEAAPEPVPVPVPVPVPEPEPPPPPPMRTTPAPPAPAAAPPKAEPAPVVDRDLFAGELMVEPEAELELAPEPVLEVPQDVALEAAPEFSLTGEPSPPPAAAPGAEVPFTFDPEPVPEPEPALPVAEVLPEPAVPVAEVDLLAEAVQAIEVVPEPVATVVPEAEAVPPPQDEMSESLFADELLSLVEGAFKEAPADEPAAAATAGSDDAPSGGGNQIVVSPLFKDFSVDELVAVIQGLNLLTYQPGEIILMEGDPGQSLYMLTSGTVRALKRNAQGRQATVGELSEGAFFGELSILSGKPRSATVVAATYCELLELDRATLDGIVKTHPRVLDILKEFAAARQKKS